jgi:TetR/AcrR family transcriptional repressor of mexJK operon
MTVEVPAELGPPELLTGAAESPKRAAVLAAAAEVFLEAGVEAASMDEIARRAKVSKATVYSHFESKQALLKSIVHERCKAMLPALSSPEFGKLPPEEALFVVGRRFLDLMFSKIAMPLYRVVLAEAGRSPEFGRAFYENGPDRMAQELAAYLREQDRAGRLRVPEPRLTAEQFIGAVLCQSHLRQLLAVTATPPGDAERDYQVRAAVRLILAATAVG